MVFPPQVGLGDPGTGGGFATDGGMEMTMTMTTVRARS
jgi:hypothetical protein